MKHIILFDGECNFCNWNVQFIIKRDPKAIFQFASLQSEIGLQLIEQYHIPNHRDSLILIEKDQYYVKSTAALRICKKLHLFWRFLSIFMIIPKKVRDFGYDIIAKNRYKLFGKSDRCMIPSPEMRKRFLS